MNAKRLKTTLVTGAVALILAGCAGAAPATPAPAAPAQATAAPTMAMPATAMPTPTQKPAPTAAPTMVAPAPTATADAMMHGGTMMTLTVAAPATAVPATAVPPATAAPKPAAQIVNVNIQVFQFAPNVLEIKAGTTVVWTNKDNIEHSITNGVPGKLGGKFDSGFFTQGKTFSFTFNEAGEYPYFCMRHNSMQGMVRVTP